MKFVIQYIQTGIVHTKLSSKGEFNFYKDDDT